MEKQTGIAALKLNLDRMRFKQSVYKVLKIFFIKVTK